jgi:hypothetical protein
MNTSGTNITENEYVKELFAILNENGRDSSGLSALLGLRRRNGKFRQNG